MRRQQFFIDSRFVIITLQMRGRGQLDEISVTGLIFGQQNQMVINVASAAAGLLFQSAARRHIDFAANNRLDAFVARGLIKINRAMEHAMIGYCQRRQLQRMRSLHQPIQPAGPVEQRIFCV